MKRHDIFDFGEVCSAFVSCQMMARILWNNSCVAIVEIDEEVTYCKKTETWQPRVTSRLFVIIPPVVAFVLLIGFLEWLYLFPI